jgi:glycosyltransferase involved in cell wall biosynthesis
MTIITGSKPPEVCGVGDFTYKLSQICECELIESKTLFSFLSIFTKTYKKNDILLQYPTQGYGWSLGPHVYTILMWLCKNPIVIHLHEYKYQSRKSKILYFIFFRFARKLITTNLEEQTSLPNYAKNKSKIIPIFSNVPKPEYNSTIRDIDLIYFGQIRPNKGIEKFIENVKNLKLSKIYIIGNIPSFAHEYFFQLSKPSNIEFKMNLNLVQVSQLLSRSKNAYLPFPDGASTRRGSLLACLEHGVRVLTTSGQSSEFLEPYVFFDDNQSLEQFIKDRGIKKNWPQINDNEIAKKIQDALR